MILHGMGQRSRSRPRSQPHIGIPETPRRDPDDFLYGNLLTCTGTLMAAEAPMRAGSLRDALVRGCCRVALHVVGVTLVLHVKPLDVVWAGWVLCSLCSRGPTVAADDCITSLPYETGIELLHIIPVSYACTSCHEPLL